MGKEMSNTSKLITAFVMIIVGVILVGVTATETVKVTTPIAVVQESLSLSPARLAGNNINTTYQFTLANAGLAEAGGWVTNSISITNASGTSLAGNFTVNYDTDRITFSNNTFMVTGGGAGNATLVGYSYYPAAYLTGFGRPIMNIVPGLFGLVILLIGVGLFYSVYKDNDLGL